MEITVSELERLSTDSYILYDTRSEQEKLYGVMEGIGFGRRAFSRTA